MCLNSKGHLSESEMDEANKLGITHMDYIPKVLGQMVKKNEERIRNREHREIVIRTRKPHIIVGHGPNWEEQARKLKNMGTTISATDKNGKELFKIKAKIPIIATDACANRLFEMGINPKYIATYEEATKNVNESMFDFDRIKEANCTVITSNLTRKWLRDTLEAKGIKTFRYTMYPAPYVSNVGLFAAYYAKQQLLAGKIILIGMNCWGPEQYPFLNWFVDWRTFVLRSDPEYVINCTEGGLLYFDRVLEADFNELRFE